MEGVPPSCNEDDVNLTSNQFDFQSQEDSFNISEFLLSPPEFSGNQSSILCNDQDGQNMVVDNNVINDSIQQTTDQFPPSFPQTMVSPYQLNPNLFDPQCVNPMLPGPSMPLRDQQRTNYPLPMSNQVPAMLPGPQPPINQWHQNSNIPEPHPGQGYMTPNATTSQNGGFNQSGPSFPAPRIQFLSNQGQDDQAAVIPDIDNMQQENFVPRNSGNSTRLPPEVPDNQSSISSRINQNEPNWPQTPSRSQMDNLQVRGLQNQTATPNASNPGLGTSLQSQNRGLNTQQLGT